MTPIALGVGALEVSNLASLNAVARLYHISAFVPHCSWEMAATFVYF